ncbi:MAG: VOC family protein [Microbacterium sp.]|uniref:VOC family protein n=1 Tax=Microbacterium sp. TaxID=51671 RepID=UPI0039E57EF2
MPEVDSTTPDVWTGTHHVRIPVADLDAARAFWERVLGYVWDFDFPGEAGPLGSAMRRASGGPNIVLWRAPALAAAAAGFTVLGIGVPDRAAIERVRDRLDAQRIEHGGLQPAFVEVKLPAVKTPGGALIAFYVQPDAAVAPASVLPEK